MHTTCSYLARPSLFYLFWREERMSKSDRQLLYEERDLKGILRKQKGGKHGVEMTTYPALSLQKSLWSQGGSWGRSRASFCLQWQGNYPCSAFPPREAPGLSAGLLEGNAHIFQHSLISLSSKKQRPRMQPVKQQLLVREAGLSTLLWWFHDP